MINLETGKKLSTRRQFVISSRPFKDLDENWQTIKINEFLYLSYCPCLPIKLSYDKHGYPIIILGNAIQTDPNRGEPIDESKIYLNEIDKCYDTWAGRWIFIKHDELHMDFAGLLGCYYLKTETSILISNSVAILSAIIEDKNEYSNEILKSKMNWYPPPCSRNPSIKSLLPSQVLLLPSGKIRPRQLFPSVKIGYTIDQALDRIQKLLITGIQNIGKANKSIWIPLSAGYDSRLLLATAIKADIPIKTYTMKKKNSLLKRGKLSTSLVSKADMELPPLIAEIADVEHKWIDIGNFSFERLRIFDEHTYKGTLENDRIYFARGQWDWTSDDDIILLGQVIEVGCCYYYNSFNASEDNIFREVANAFKLEGSSIQYQGIYEYCTWLRDYNNVYCDDIDWRDRFYLEQRLSGWLRANQQGLDLVKGETIHLYNSQEFICTLLSLPNEKRKNKEFIIDLINNMAPELNQIPYNPPNPLSYELKIILVKLTQNSIMDIVQSIYRRIKNKRKK